MTQDDLTWPQFFAKFLINEWGTKRGVPPPEFAPTGLFLWLGLIDRDHARRVTKELRETAAR